MESEGLAFARAYWYKDDGTTIYLDCLSVDPSVRRQGIGTELQELRESMGEDIFCRFSCLWVLKDSWMHEWYRRRGYFDLKDHDQEENAVWMMKTLK